MDEATGVVDEIAPKVIALLEKRQDKWAHLPVDDPRRTHAMMVAFNYVVQTARVPDLLRRFPEIYHFPLGADESGTVMEGFVRRIAARVCPIVNAWMDTILPADQPEVPA